MANPEIMIEIEDNDLPELASMYKPYEDDLPYVYSFIQTCIKAKNIGKSNFVTLMSPRNSWRDDGTFFAIMPQYGHDIFVHSLDVSGKNIVDGLLHTQKFKFPQDQGLPFSQFFAVHENFCPVILETLREQLHLDLKYQKECTMYCLQKENALQTTISVPSDVYIKEISPDEAHIMDSVWPRKYPGSEERLKNLLEINEGYGVYHKSNDQLVSWITLSCLGQLSVLQTLEEHKKKGYASLITKYMCKKLAEKGFHSFGSVNLGNRPSELLFEKLGFRKLGICQYIGVKM